MPEPVQLLKDAIDCPLVKVLAPVTLRVTGRLVSALKPWLATTPETTCGGTSPRGTSPKPLTNWTAALFAAKELRRVSGRKLLRATVAAAELALASPFTSAVLQEIEEVVESVPA
jgi:cation transporter-like permease